MSREADAAPFAASPLWRAEPGRSLVIRGGRPLACAQGASAITEAIFEQRFRHVDELRKMGANIAVRGRTAWVHGVARLSGARVIGSDVRAAAALVLAGLSAEGETILEGLDHLDSGYERMTEKLVACGAAITRSAA